MSYYGGKDKGERPHHRIKIERRERERRRGHGASGQKQTIADQHQRIVDLHQEISDCNSPQRLWEVYKQFTNGMITFSDDAARIDDIRRFFLYEDTNDDDLVRRTIQDSPSGRYEDFLPLKFVAQLLKKTPEYQRTANDKYCYLLGSSSLNDTSSRDVRTRQALEWMLYMFSARIPSGTSLQMRINNVRYSRPAHDASQSYGNLEDSMAEVGQLRKGLERVPHAQEYVLTHIRDGRARLTGTRLLIATETRMLTWGEESRPVLFSYMVPKPEK